MSKKSSGKVFEKRIENVFLKSQYFSDDVFSDKGFINVFNYRDYMQNTSMDFDDVVRQDSRKLLLFKNFPVNNDIAERTEFGVCHKVGGESLKWRIECKFQDVNGSTNKKIEHEIQQFRRFKDRNGERYFVLVYDGEFYRNKPNIIADVLEEIRYDYNILFLNFKQFKTFLNDYLNHLNKITEVFTKHFKAQYK